MKIDWLDKLRFYLQTLAFCLAVASIQFAFQPQVPYALPLVYSIFIGTSTWAVVDFGRHLFVSSAQTGWPQGTSGVLLPLTGIVAGYVLGTLAGDTWFGWSSWDEHGRSQLPVSIGVTALAGITATYYFYSRNQSAYLEVKASEASRQAVEARLKLLESQIEPHMLFNTLANLRALIATDPPRALHMLDHLHAYLRATLNASRTPLHPLHTEFDRLHDYLELMAIRMGPRLQYRLDLPAELAQVPVPPLLLQPLVENSIKHGLEPKLAGGSIVVRASQRGGLVTLEVTDTGVGQPPPPPHGQAPQDAGEAVGTGLGLAQVRARLANTYGHQFTINKIANNTAGTGTCITFPL